MALLNGGSAFLNTYYGIASTATLRPDWGQLNPTTGNAYPPIVVAGVPYITIYSVSPRDSAILADVNGSRATFNGTPNRSWLQDYAGTYTNQVFGFTKVTAIAGPASNDTAYLTDAGGPSSVLNASPGYASLQSNHGIITQALGYRQVYAIAAAGNCDIANLTGGPGTNNFNGSSAQSIFSGTGIYCVVNSFAQVHVYAAAGSTDIAYLTDTNGGMRLQWHCRPLVNVRQWLHGRRVRLPGRLRHRCCRQERHCLPLRPRHLCQPPGQQLALEQRLYDGSIAILAGIQGVGMRCAWRVMRAE